MMFLRDFDHQSVRFQVQNWQLTSSNLGSLPEEVKWQFQTIQKTSSKVHVRASR